MPSSAAGSPGLWSWTPAGSGPSTAEVGNYAQQFAVPAAVAAENLSRQERGAGIVGQLRTVLGRKFAGVWFDNQSGEFVVPLLPSVPPASVEAVFANDHLNDQYRTERARSSWEELEEAQRKLTSLLKARPDVGGFRTALNPSANQLALTVQANLPAQLRTELSHLAAAPNGPTVVSNSARPGLANLACYRGPTLDACSPPLRGGMAVGVHREPQCTAGFKVLGNTYGHRFILTAGHCEEAAGALTGPWEAWNDAYNGDGICQCEEKPIGYMEDVHREPHDWALLNATGSYWDTYSWAGAGSLVVRPRAATGTSKLRNYRRSA